MAPLRAETDGPRSRAQILLVTALVLGVAFVALAVILNSAIFTENLASRGDTTGADEVVSYQSSIERGAEAVLAYENDNASSGESHTLVSDRIEAGIDETNDVMVRRHARQGAIADVSIVSHTDGSRVFQTDHTRNFTDGNHNVSWTAAASVDTTRSFRMNVSKSGLSSTCILPSDCFTVTVTNGSSSWSMSVADNSGVEIEVDNGTATESCDPVDEPFVNIDVTAGTVGGEPCSALSFNDVPNPPYDIEYSESDEIEGTYTMVVDEAAIADPPPGHFGVGDDPTVTAAIYDLTLAYEYENTDLFVAQEIRVAPGETDG